MSSLLSSKSAVALISGSGSNLQAIIDAIGSNELQLKLSAVISNISGVKGLERAELAKIPSKCIRHQDYPQRNDYEKELLGEVNKYSPDYIILAGFMRILSPFFINNFIVGKIFIIRDASVIAPSFIGTFKSTLTITFFPFKIRS